MSNDNEEPSPPAPEEINHALAINHGPFHRSIWKKVTVPGLINGCVILRILATPVPPYTKRAFDEYVGICKERKTNKPAFPGSIAVARVVDVANDVEDLDVDQLVLFDPLPAANDDPEAQFASLTHEGLSHYCLTFMQRRDCKFGSYADSMRARAEDCLPLDEAKLMGDPEEGLGYLPEQLCEMTHFLRPFGGLTSIGVRRGETVLIFPATSFQGTAACMVALAMGAKVIAWSPSDEGLHHLERILSKTKNGSNGGFRTVLMTENARYNKLALRLMGQIDAFLDISATGIKNPPQLEVGFVSLKPKGRVSLMGSYEEVKIPDDHHIRGKDITLKTFWTYKREDVPPVIKMVENGDLKLSKELGGIGSSFGLHRWKFAVERASISDESIFLTPQLLY